MSTAPDELWWMAEPPDDPYPAEPPPPALHLDQRGRRHQIELRELVEPMATPAPALPFQTFVDMAREVDAAGPRRWLIRRIWPAGAYGVHAAEPKAGKTWNALDLPVSVATGTAWLGQHPIDTAGPVVVFAGEGGKGNIVRRVRAIATARGITTDDLPIDVCARAPKLAADDHLAAMAERLQLVRPTLVVVDPLYLAAGGADGKDLYAMGALLEKPQHLYEDIGASLVVVTHFNRSRDLKGAARMTGAGPAEWGRVLISAAVLNRHTNPATQATTVLTELEVQGGEVPDQTIRVRRVIRAVDPDDLDSPLEYAVDEPDRDGPTPTAPGGDLTPAGAKLLATLDAQDTPQPWSALIDHIAATHGHGLKRPTVSTELNKLRDRSLADYLNTSAGKERLWYRIRTENPT